MCPDRFAGALDAFLLKALIEEVHGYPTELVSDGLIDGIESELDGPESVYMALDSGAVHIYPEVPLGSFAGRFGEVRLVRCRCGCQRSPRYSTSTC